VNRNLNRDAGAIGSILCPVGTGPFRYVAGTLDTGIVMERFESYYGGSPDLPAIGPSPIKRVIFWPMPREDERLEALATGKVQIVQGVSPGRIDTVEHGGRARIEAVEGTRSCQIELNNAQPPFNDIRVRLALKLAIDWTTILKQVYHGFGQPLATCFLPSGFGFHSALPSSVPNPGAVRLLLDSAGYEALPHGDGAIEGNTMKPLVSDQMTRNTIAEI
jgi:peptide/nickel transport system substrate-binding protein